MKRIHIALLSILVSATAFSQECRLFTTKDGLSSSLINCVYQDRSGTIWVGTDNGLNSYDGTKIRVYNKIEGDGNSICHCTVRSIFEDSRGNLIVGTLAGVQILDRESDTFRPVMRLSDGTPYMRDINGIIERRNGEVWIYGNRILRMIFRDNAEPYLEQMNLSVPLDRPDAIFEDSRGNLWVSNYHDGLYMIAPNGNMYHYEPEGLPSVNGICEAGDGTIMIASSTNGVRILDRSSDEFVRPENPELDNARVNVVYYAGSDIIYIGTDNKGTFEYNTVQHRLTKVVVNNTPLESDKIKTHSLIRDKDGNVWMGAYQKGLIFMPERRNGFHYIGSHAADKDFIGSCCVNALFVDGDGLLWVGTDNDGIYTVDPKKGPVDHYRVEDGVPGTTFGLTSDSKGNVWFGSYSEGLWRMNRKTGRAENAADFISGMRRHISPYSIVEDKSGRIWAGTMGNGLVCYNPASGSLLKVEANRTMNQWISFLYVSSDGNLQACTYDGVYTINTSGNEFTVKSHFLNGQIAYSFLEYEGNYYVGTTNGLYVDNGEGEQTLFTMEDGLPNNTVFALVDDNMGKIWISTNYGLSNMNPTTKRFTNYYLGDGIQGNEFCRSAFAKKNDSAIFFGGTDGVTVFLPGEIEEPETNWATKITGFHLADRDIYTAGKKIFRLKPGDRSCIIDFATTAYNAPDAIVFSYKVDNNPWANVAKGNPSVSLSNLKHGQHKFLVKATYNGLDSDPTEITIKIPHFWYGSLPALFVYLLLISAALATITIQYRNKRSMDKEMERHKQAEELNEAKLQFFTNVSHEIRTPMTLIDSPLQNLLETDSDPERQRIYSVMSRNAKRILQLINQMLDARKIDEGRMKLHFTPEKIVDLISSICELFSAQAQKKNISLDFRYGVSRDTELWIDAGQFDKIIVNLLSNAIKFTPDNGRIEVSVNQQDQNLKIKVKDNGTGIPENDLKKIFERFYQSGKSASGTGIGLNLTHLLVELHHGDIKADNNPDGKGCTFTVTIPLGNAHLSDEEKAPVRSNGNEEPLQSSIPIVVEEPGSDHGKPLKRRNVLIVDDDLEILNYLQQSLSRDFHITEARNGKQAIEMMLREKPDLVISDVMMPEMDGFTFCRKVRKNININSVPIILLSAKALDSDTIEGLENGADAYITKPFNLEVLRTTSMNLINSRERLKVAFAEKQTIEKDQVAEVSIKTPDERLLERVVKVINDNISNPGLTVEMIAGEVGISRVHLHRKLKELTNQTSRDFVRNIRLNKAAGMLREKKHSIAELADSVGFPNAANFATAFRELFGMSPTEYMNNKPLS